MSRIEGVKTGGGLLARVTRWGSKMMFGKVVTPIDAMSLSRPLLWGVGQMDLALNRFKGISPTIRHLAERLNIQMGEGCVKRLSSRLLGRTE